MLLKTGIVVIRTSFFHNPRTGNKVEAKYIWWTQAINIVSLPGIEDMIFVPNGDGEGSDLEVVGIDHDLERNWTTVYVTADIADQYKDLRDEVRLFGTG